LTPFGEGLIGHFVAHLLDHASRERLWKVGLLPCKLISPNEDLRVSFSAFLRIRQGDSYLLVRSLHRKEAFGPFGGVYKYLSGAHMQLDALEFRPQTGKSATDMQHDLRGFVPRRNIFGVARWFEQGAGREDAVTCLRRELIEELAEVKLKRHAVPDLIRFKPVRRVQEGPARAAGQPYWQYRVFDIYDVAEPDAAVGRFLDGIRSLASSHQGLLLATAHEIIVGRSSDGRVIGHHSGYLFGRKRIRPDEPMFIDDIRSEGLNDAT
jgi:hypothetical protein